MDEYRYREYDFNDPPKIQILLESVIYGLAGRFVYRPVIDLLCLEKYKSILDFGCGGGFLIKRISGLFGDDVEITGIDSSRFYINAARKRLKDKKNIKLLCGEIDELVLNQDLFDIAIINYVLHDIRPNRRKNIIRSLAKCSKSICAHEPLRPSHGIKATKLRSLFLSVGMKEKSFKQNCSRYIGIWERSSGS